MLVFYLFKNHVLKTYAKDQKKPSVFNYEKLTHHVIFSCPRSPGNNDLGNRLDKNMNTSWTNLKKLNIFRKFFLDKILSCHNSSSLFLGVRGASDEKLKLISFFIVKHRSLHFAYERHRGKSNEVWKSVHFSPNQFWASQSKTRNQTKSWSRQNFRWTRKLERVPWRVLLAHNRNTCQKWRCWCPLSCEKF